MTEDSDENRENKLLKEAKERQQGAADFGAETVGYENGRLKRFLPEEADPASIRKRRQRDSERISALMALLNSDPDYAALYAETVELSKEYAAQAEDGVETSLSALSVAGQTLESVTDKAAKLHPGGEPVFRDKKGKAVRADGTPLKAEETATVVWPDGAPTHEEYLKAKITYDDAQEQHQAWRDYQLYIGGVQNRLNDVDNPLAPEELREIQNSLQERVPSANAADAKLSLQTDQDLVRGTSGIDTPPL